MFKLDEETLRNVVLFLTLILPVIGTWLFNGFPTDRASLGFLSAALVTAILTFLQRWQEKKSLKRKGMKVKKDERQKM